MEGVTPTLIAVGFVNLLMFPLLVFLIKRFVGQRLDRFDESRELARREAEDARTESRLWRTNITNGIKSLLRAELLHEHTKWTSRGWCPLESKEYLKRLHDAYAGVGGNDMGDRLYQEVMDLPTKAR